jgi:hypothetical protein
MSSDQVESARHIAVLVVRAPKDAADWQVCFEPEGGVRIVASGEKLRARPEITHTWVLSSRLTWPGYVRLAQEISTSGVFTNVEQL